MPATSINLQKIFAGKKKSGGKIRKTYNWFHHKSKHKSIQMHTKDAKIAATLINLQKIFAKIKK